MGSEPDMHICLVCHTEPDVWDGGFRSIDQILPQFREMLTEVQDGVGAHPRVAWCLTSQVAGNRAEPFRELLDAGHEIGVHSHFPSANGKLEHQQELNRDHLSDFGTWFPKLCCQIVDAGFPSPRTHATWMFAYRDSMTSVLAASRIRAECSVCYGGAHHLPDGFLLADSRRRSVGLPYRLSETDHCTSGDSPVVELPVSGGFGCYWQPNEEGVFQFFSPVASDAETDRQAKMFQDRLDALPLKSVDVFQIHFHLYEFLPPDGTGEARMRRAERLLNYMGKNRRVRFSTPSEAVDYWAQGENVNASGV